jgi:hypothetical protein
VSSSLYGGVDGREGSAETLLSLERCRNVGIRGIALTKPISGKAAPYDGEFEEPGAGLLSEPMAHDGRGIRGVKLDSMLRSSASPV